MAQPLGALGVGLIVVRTEAEAHDLVRQLQAGEPFDELARRHSIDPSSGNGGYLSGITVPQLRTEFQNALRGVTPGQFAIRGT